MQTSLRPFLRLLAGFGAAAVFLISANASADAQQQPSPPPAPPPRENPGLVNEIGKLLKAPEALLPSFSWPGSQPDAPAPDAPPVPPAASVPPPPPAPLPTLAAPPAAAASPMVPAMIDGRQVCPSSANGAADCAAGATILCRAKGYQQGRSLAVDATEKCSAKVLIPGRTREPGDCRTENFVTRAWCQ